MADGYDRFDTDERGSGASFVMGLLAGTVLGAGLGMLFAPKSGSEMRSRLSEQAGNWADTAQDGWRRASDAAGDIANRGREIYEKTRDAVSRGADEARRYVGQATGEEMSGHQMASGSGGMTGAPAYGGSHATSTSTHGSQTTHHSGGGRA
jgi:gas vesicle protein